MSVKTSWARGSPHILAENVVQAPCPDVASVSVKDPIVLCHIRTLNPRFNGQMRADPCPLFGKVRYLKIMY